MSVKHEIHTRSGLKMKDLNRTKAIRWKCLDCCGFLEKDVKDCEKKECPLNEYRMKTNPNSGAKRTKDLKAYCNWCINGTGYYSNKCIDFHCSLWPFRKGGSTDFSRDGVSSITDED